MNTKTKNIIRAAFLGLVLFAGGAHAESSFQCDRLEVTAENLLILKTKIKDAGDYMTIVEARARKASNKQEGKTILGLGVFMALADGENELATALIKVTDICESLGYEETKQVFHGFADDYFDALEEVRGK